MMDSERKIFYVFRHMQIKKRKHMYVYMGRHQSRREVIRAEKDLKGDKPSLGDKKIGRGVII